MREEGVEHEERSEAGQVADWPELWHRSATETLSKSEAEALALALQDPHNRTQAERWQRLQDQLGNWLRAVPAPPGGSLAPTLAADIALSAALERSPAAPFSLAAGLSRQIAAEGTRAAQEAATQTQGQTVHWAPSGDVVADWLKAQPAPALPGSQAAVIARAIAQEAQTHYLQQPQVAPEHYGQAPVGRWLAGVSTLLAFGGLGVLEHWGGARAIAPAVAITAPLRQQGLLAPISAAQPLQQHLAALSTPSTLLGLALLIVGSALVVWRPEPIVRRLALGLLALAALLSIPALWSSLSSLRASSIASWEPLLFAGLLLQMALLFVGGQARALVSQQRHFPLQALAAGTLSTLGLVGLGLLLLSWGLLWAAPLLGVALLLAIVVGLGISLLSLGRALGYTVGRRVPAAGWAVTGWLGTFASLGIYGASLALPPLAGLLLLIGGAWGLGSVVLPRQQGASALLKTNS